MEHLETIVKSLYNESHRYFHNMDHINDILKLIDIHFTEKTDNTTYYDAFVVAAYFHDSVYDPRHPEYSVSKSISFLISNTIRISSNPVVIDLAIDLIKGTNIYDENKCTPEQNLFNSFDRDVLTKPLKDLISYGDKIWKEYSFLDRDHFISEHIKLLKSIDAGKNPDMPAYFAYIKCKKIRVGIYPGSFNPFHKGHKFIVSEANKIFDKVVISIGDNPDKKNTSLNFKVCDGYLPNVKYFEVVKFNGLLSDLVNYYEDKNYDVTIIKGIRDGMDLDYENKQRLFLKDFKPDLKYVYIPCSNDYSYISSNMLRVIEKFGKSIDNYI